jgi:hypothetical protein
MEVPYRLVVVKKNNRVEGTAVVSNRYQLILHKELVEEVKKNTPIVAMQVSKNIGIHGRVLLETPSKVEALRICFVVENSYAKGSAKLYLFLKGATLFPVGLLLRKIHLKNSITSNWKDVMRTTRKLLQLLEKSRKVRIPLSLVKKLEDVETAYYRRTGEGFRRKVIKIGEEIYAELSQELGDFPTVYELWESLSRKNYERRKGLTLVAKRKIERIILSLLKEVEERERAGVQPRFISL